MKALLKANFWANKYTLFYLKSPLLIYRFLLFIGCSFSLNLCFSQAPNLVPNGSFEERINCIYNDSSVDDAPPWFNPTNATPDVFHQCALVNEEPCPWPEQYILDPWFFGIPTNGLGCESPYDGEGYGGLFVAGHNVNGYNGYKEYLGVRLTHPLIPGNQYTLKFALSLPERVGYAIWNVQVWFSSDSIYQNNDTYINANPQLSGDSGQYITNYDGWHEMAWDYTATGEETFMYIGNFQPDSITDTLYVLQEEPEDNFSMFSYYYIDKIELKEGTLNTTDNPNKEKYKLYPNPVSDHIIIKSEIKIKNLLILDLQGRVVRNPAHNISSSDYQIDISDLANGMFVVRLIFEDGFVASHKIVKR